VNVVAKHPNATTTLVTSSGGGALVSWLLDDVGHFGVPAFACAAIAGGLGAAALFIGRNGLHGVVRFLWRGTAGSGPK
jgi:hypothetical protein